MTADLEWRVHAVLSRSRANGPGARFVVWTQGCSLQCAGCFNPGTHAATAPAAHTVRDIVAQALAEPDLDGVTVTGGEPLEQPEALGMFLSYVAAAGRGSVVLSGFTRREITANARRRAAVVDADMIITGRYNATLRLASGLRGSANQRYWSRTGRYDAAMFDAVPEAEVLIDSQGTMTVTGVAGPVLPMKEPR
ncbi:4Fe-4S cluster-binding domain-containing protein [Dactylosporangium siamense]|uniref:4Fe-4S cluster-binding domain-containing protein n=1 Tax=Dactylosporangium siamense TaxID=685454 RepID=UPI0019444795|nr:4Fe-4S cluster-binding domain-containing protein [Dactylosporangium siamense]